MVAILGYSRDQIRDAVQDMYTEVAEAPSSPFHFPVGRQACALLGYSADEMEVVPPGIVESFAGVGYPFRANAIRPGDTTLDIGAGAGNDTLIASTRVGPEGHVVAVDMTAAMTRKLKQNTSERYQNIDVLQATAEQLPISSESVDSITSNGVVNLVPNKRLAIAEMFRVLRPGGQLQLADVVIDRPVNVDCEPDPRLWVECIVGATVEDNLLAMLGDAGFEETTILHRLDYFAHSPSAQTREIAAAFGAHSIELSARRSAQAPRRIQRWLRRMDPKRWLGDLRRRGWLGISAVLLALLSCYGTLAAIGLLASFGFGKIIDPALWSGFIAIFTWLATGLIIAGYRHHRSFWPALISVTGATMVSFALFVNYWLAIELSGFMILLGGAFLDLRLRHYEQARQLGLNPRNK